MTLLAEIALVVLGGIALSVCLALLPGAPPGRRRSQPPVPERPSQLVALERLAITAGSNAVQAHAYLRPRLVEIASHRLVAHGQTLDRMPDALGRELLGDRLWEIVRPERPFPADRQGPGVGWQELAAMLDVLERL
ncbi:MAG TPA: hypothetical protein VMF57_05840 [Solirubrobacteraceae bacterium]|nr:hypothetical protein [Solirubrobacteraceae bacterium]